MDWIAGQLKLDPIFFRRYQWKGQTFKHHLSIIRKYTGFRPCEHDDHLMVIEWLTQHGSKFSTRKEWREATISRFREIKIELPVEKKFRRLVNSARGQFLNSLYKMVFERIAPAIREMIDECLQSPDTEKSRFDWMKLRPDERG